MSDLGGRIQTYRVVRGLSLTELAALSGVSKGYLSTLETQQTQRPGVEVLFKIAQALDVSVSDLMGKSEHVSTSAWQSRAELAEDRIREALTRLEREAAHSWRTDRMGQLIEGLGCILTGQESGWWPK